MQHRDVAGARLFSKVATAALISGMIAMPVEMITGFPVTAQALSRSHHNSSYGRHLVEGG
jgi:hypothetical protein